MFAVLRSACKGLRLLTVPLVALALAACEPISLGGINSGPSIDTTDPVPVALLVPRGSGAPGDEVLAQSLENAARLAAQDLSGVEIDLRVYATAANAETAAAQAVQAVNDGAKIILGPVYAEAANAAGIAASAKGVNILSFSNNAGIAGGNVFVLGSTFQNTANRLVDFAASQGKTNFVIVHAQDFAEQQGRDAISTAIAANGANLVGTVEYTLSQQGVIDAIPQIKTLVDEAGADSLFLTSSSAGALPLFAQLLPEAGVDPELIKYIGLTRWDIPQQTLNLPGIQGGWFALPDPSISAGFSQRYEATYGELPHPIAGLAFDGVAAIGALVQRGNRDALTSTALTQPAGFAGASGVFRLNADGTNTRGLSIATILENRVIITSAAPRSFNGSGF